MRKVKLILLSLCGLLLVCLILIAVLLATIDHDDYCGILSWSIEHFTDYKVSINGTCSLDLAMEPSLSVSEILVRSDVGEDGPFSAQIGHLRVKIALTPLLTGNVHIRELLGENGNFAFTGGGSSDKDEGSNFRSIPVLENVTLRNVKISYSDRGEDVPLQVNLHSFRIDEARSGGSMYVKGKGTVNDADFVIESIVPRGTPVSPEAQNADLKLNMKAKSTKLFKTYLFDWLPDTGPVHGEARLTGTLKAPELRAINITAGKPQNVWIYAQGSVGSIPLDPDLPVSGIELSLSIDSDKPKVLFSGLDMTLPELASVSGKSRLRGSGDKLQFEEITIQATDPAGVKLDLSGSATLEQRGKKTPLGRLDLNVSLKAPSISSFRHLLQAKALPDLAPASFTSHITGTTEVVSLEDIVIQAGHPGPLHFEWRGRIGKIIFESDKPVSEVEISSSFYAEKTSLFSKYVGVSIPDLGPLESTARIVARKEGYGVDDIELVIGGKENVRLKAKGRIEYVMRGTSVGMDGIDLSVTMPELDGKAFSKLLGQHLAAIGKLSGSLSISGGQEDLSVSDADLVTVSPDGLKISARGGISHILVKEEMPFHGVDIKLSVTAPDISPIRKISGLDLPDLGPLSVNLGVNDRDKALIIDPLQIRTGPEKKPTLLIEGMMHPVAGQDRVTGTLTFKTRTSQWSEKFLGHPVPEDHLLEGDLRLSGRKNNEHLEGTIKVGKTKFLVTVERSLKNERPLFTAKLSAPKIYLSDLYIYPEVPPDNEDQSKKPGSASDSRLFSDEPLPFDSLKKLDLSLDLDADEVIGKDFTFHDLNLDVALDGGYLQKRIPKLTHADGFVSIEAAIDARGTKPELMLKVTAEDIDAEALLAHTHSSMLLGGHLNMALDLRSTGSSPREIASALKGEIGIAIENGKIKKLADLMGADAIDMVTTSYKLGKYQKLNCLAMTFAFDNGIGTSKVIYLDTPDVRSVGKGTMNLQEETIDIVIKPKPKKSKLGGSSPVRINGPLAKPHIVKIPLRAAARLTGEILMPYVFLPARASGYVWSLMKNDKDEASPCLRPESQTGAQ